MPTNKLINEIDALLTTKNGPENVEIYLKEKLNDLYLKSAASESEYLDFYFAKLHFYRKIKAPDSKLEECCSQILFREPQNQDILLQRAMLRYHQNKIVLSELDFDALNPDFLAEKRKDEKIDFAEKSVKKSAPEAKKQEIDKMINFGKNLSNKILGKFGLSLNNFEMTDNPDGTKSINIKK